MASIEEKVEEYYKGLLNEIGLRHFAKTEKVNDSIENALKEANSKAVVAEIIILILSA